MAKGRKLTASRSERLLGSYGHENGGGGGGGSELREDDVWSSYGDRVNEEEEDRSEWSGRSATFSTEGGGSLTSYRSHRHPPPARGEVGGLSLAFDDSNGTTSRILHQYRNQERVMSSPCGRVHVATSAPVNVPDWSKIYRVDSVESMHDSDDGVDDDSDWIPPHEYLAREYARTGKSNSNSVFEGVGRTLKGRDMSRVRDAVWSQTGFDG